MSVSVPLALLLAVTAAEPGPTDDVANLPVEAAVGFAAGPLRAQARVMSVLSRWERASSQLSPLTAAERDRAHRWYRGTLTAHEAAVATAFRGAVSVKALLRDYRWSGEKRLPGEIRLTATPHDPVERLFYSRFEVRLITATMLPNATQFHHDDDRPTMIVAIPVEITPAKTPAAGAAIRLVKAEIRSPIAAPQPLPQIDKKTQRRALDVLRRWRESATRIDKIESGFYRFTYDRTFNIEERAIGTFHFEHPNRFAIQSHPVKISAGERSQRVTSQGKHFALKAGRRESLLFDGNKLVQIYDGQTTELGIVDPKNPARFESLFLFRKDIPVDDLLASWLPFARPTKSIIERHYDWRIEKESANEVWLVATPKTLAVKSSVAQWKCILNRTTWSPIAVRCIDPGRNRETVYVTTKWITLPRAAK